MLFPEATLGSTTEHVRPTVFVTGFRESDDGVTRYVVETRFGDNAPIISLHRYSDFEALHAARKSAKLEFTVPKEWFETRATKERRIATLQAYVRAVVAEQAELDAATSQFLQVGSGAALLPPAIVQALATVDPSMPPGLCTVLEQACEAFPLRIMIVDNSGSMNSTDGSRLVRTTASGYRTLRCTRWQELGADVVAVAQMAEALASVGARARTDFHLLNPTAGFSSLIVGGHCDSVLEHGVRAPLATVAKAMETSPLGSTPLTEALIRVISQIEPAAGTLRSRGEQVAVILATDGLPNNPATFLHAVHRLQTLPVWLVVRLCTDQQEVVDYWNELDRQLEASIEVLDDVKGEAEEICAANRWLAYGPALHLARMFGLPDKLFDALDESSLAPSQCKQFAERLLGCDPLPEPQLDRVAFIAQLRRALQATPQTYEPLSGRSKPWIDASALDDCIRRANGESQCVLM